MRLSSLEAVYIIEGDNIQGVSNPTVTQLAQIAEEHGFDPAVFFGSLAVMPYGTHTAQIDAVLFRAHCQEVIAQRET